MSVCDRKEEREAAEAEWRATKANLETAKEEAARALKAEKQTRVELESEIQRLRESLEVAMAASQAKAERRETEDLRNQLKERLTELEEAREKVRATEAELDAVRRAKETKEKEVAQTNMEREAGGAALAAAEAKLNLALEQLGRSESAQVRQEGFYFSVAPGPVNGGIHGGIGGGSNPHNSSQVSLDGGMNAFGGGGARSSPRSPPRGSPRSPPVVHAWQAFGRSSSNREMLSPSAVSPGGRGLDVTSSPKSPTPPRSRRRASGDARVLKSDRSKSDRARSGRK